MFKQICEISPEGCCVWVGQQYGKSIVFCIHCNRELEVGYVHYLEAKLTAAIELIETGNELQALLNEELQKKNERIEIQKNLISTQIEIVETLKRMARIR